MLETCGDKGLRHQGQVLNLVIPVIKNIFNSPRKLVFKRGFTLIELLVVIAIIAILAGLLLPVLAKTKQKGQATICLNDLKQVGLAMQMFADDNDDMIPRGTAVNSPRWWMEFMPYLSNGGTETDNRNIEIFMCPSYPILKNTPNKSQVITYVVNAFGFGSTSTCSGETKASEDIGLSKITTFKSSSDSAYLLDNEDGIDTGLNRPIITSFQDFRTDLNGVWLSSHLPYGSAGKLLSKHRRIAANRHNDGSNILFIDGHSGFRKAKLIDIDLFREKKL